MFMKVLCFLVCVVAVTNAVEYATLYTYSGNDCVNANALSQTTTIASGLCSTIAFTCKNLIVTSSKRTCTASVPAGYGIESTAYSVNTNCTGDANILSRSSGNLKNCTLKLGLAGNYEMETCSAAKVLVTQEYSDNQCTVKVGAAVTSNDFNICLAGTVKKVCVGGVGASGICFHKDTVITYKGKEYNMKDFIGMNHKECTVPHVVVSQGVVITTDCKKAPLRLTDSHLVVTRKNGMKMMIAAKDLRQGDVVFSNMEETQVCKVVNVVREETSQRYFGLNCLESEVLASGIKTSTFGVIHRLPAMWMKHASKLLGVHRASRWGVKLAAIPNSFGLLK